MATRDDLPAVVGTASQALLDDPVMKWTFGDDRGLHRRLMDSGSLWTGALVELGGVWCLEDGAAMSAWIWPDDIPELYSIDLQIRPPMMAIALDGARYSAFWDWIDGQGPTEPYCYLDQLCVRPGHQRRGLGAALLDHGVARAHAEGLRCGLMARTPAHIEYFSRAGFDTADELKAPDGGPTIWPMFT
jgi:GNAT superfamily N-acetyltransferase